jgi:hypothetical protein
VTEPAAPAVRQKKRAKKSGGDGRNFHRIRRFTPRGMIEEYLTLCRNPAADLRRWIAEDKKKPGGFRRRILATTRGGIDHNDTSAQAGWSRLAYTYGIRGHSLLSVRNGLDPQGGGGRGDHGMSARPRAGTGRYDALRPVRAQDSGDFERRGEGGVTTHGDSEPGEPDLSHIGTRSVILALYGAKIEATRRSLPRREIAAAVRALRDEQRTHLRAITARKRDAIRAWRERTQIERFARKQVQLAERRLEKSHAPAEAKPT